MAKNPTYKELELRIKELEKECAHRRLETEELMERHSMMEAVLQKAADGICVCHNTSEEPYVKFTHWNPPMTEITGYTIEEINKLGWYQSMYPDPEVQRRAIDRMARMRQGDDIKAEEWLITAKDGGKRTLSISTSVVKEEGGRVHVLAIIQDITDRKRAEDALRLSEEKFRFLAEKMGDIVWTLDLDFRTTYVSVSIEKVLGFTPEERKRQSLEEMITRESLQRVQLRFAEELGRDEEISSDPDRSITMEVEYYKKDGSTVWMENSVKAIRDQSGSIVGIYGVSRDITERKRAEEALRESEALLAKSQEIAHVGSWELDLEGDRLIWSDQVYRIFGLEPSEFKATYETFLDAVHPEDRTAVDAAYSSGALREGKDDYEIEHRVIRKRTGEVRYVHGKSFHVRDTSGRIVRSVGMVQDITERKRAEESLRKSEERYRTILESITEGYYEVNLAGNLTFFNDSVCELLGYSRNELTGMNDRQYTSAESARTLYRAFNEVYRTGRPTKGFDWEVIRKDGTKRFVEASVALMRDEEGNPTGFRGIVRDVTERKRDEEEKKKLEAKLQQAQKMEAIGTLAGGIAHDFNNLLMGIQGRASLMLADMHSSNPHLEHLRGIEEYVRSAADLTKQLLGFARGGKYEVKVTDLNELMDRSTTLFGRTRKEITIHRRFQSDLWTVEVDQGQIEQVLLNLFVNASQAMPAGGELYLQTQNVVLDEAYVKPHGVKPGLYDKISVTDTGTGMDEQTKRRLFDPFFTTKGMGRGTGLGLASAYGIIKNHDGIITVYSEKGHGSTFNIYIPASGKGVSEEMEPIGDFVAGEGTILLVDDEEMILEVGRPLLEKLGYEVLEAGSGKEAIELYRENMDLTKMVILDMVMPQMSGGETFDQLRAINPNVKVLLSSGYSINGQAQEILNRGCEGFIQKPFNLMELSQRLREILGKA